MTNELENFENDKDDGSTTSIIERNPKEPYYVVLPCEVKDFQHFVAGLLGKPQEMRGEIEGTFKIGTKEVSDVFHLLQQRMKKQNDSSLIHFGITVYYDDGHSVVHNNNDDFISYLPITDTYPIGISITATYLIKFGGHEIPEKQEIEINIATRGDFKNNHARWFVGGYFDFKITHTERTWATDIAGLLKNYGKRIIIKQSPLGKFLRQRSDELVIYFSYFILIVSVFLWTKYGLNIISDNKEDLNKIIDITTFFVKSVPTFVMLITMVFVVKTYTEHTAFFIRNSSIILSEEDIAKHNEREKRKLFGVLKYIAIWVGTVLTGIFSNIIYSKNLLW